MRLHGRPLRVLAGCLLLLAAVLGRPAAGFESGLLESVVSVLPTWPNGPPNADEPEGTAVAIRAGGHLVTALHVVGRASEIRVRLSDGRILPASLLAGDPGTDLAVLKLEHELPVPAFGPQPGLADPVCAIGNQLGFGLSVTCGVVSAVARTGMGFNPIEDFIQTDAAINPGASGGALVDAESRLVGVISAILTKESDANIGINFAASIALVERVVEDLIAHGRVIRARSGMRVEDLGRDERGLTAGARVTKVFAESAAAHAGLEPGDVVVSIADRRITQASDVTAAIQLHRPGDNVALQVLRTGAQLSLELALPD